MPLGSESKQARFKMGRMPGTTTIEERILHSTHNVSQRGSLLKARAFIPTQGKPLRQCANRIISSGLIEEHGSIPILSRSRIRHVGCSCPQRKERNKYDKLQGTNYYDGLLRTNYLYSDDARLFNCLDDSSFTN